LQGNINYANPYFIEVSGFTEEELIGAPQNIVRHPDMPVEAFADLWSTIKSGMPWTGLVKNRCKNGDFYWVLANVTPVIENGKPVGYLSVRTKPSREQVRAADALYREIKGGNPRKLRIVNGRAVSTGLAARVKQVAHVAVDPDRACDTVLVGVLAIVADLLFAEAPPPPMRMAGWRRARGAGGHAAVWPQPVCNVALPLRQATKARA
jgi:aerotaxis receptor